jgi:farnesol dehydrogenase
MNQYFVTGGTGFIGSKLVAHLLENGEHVTALVREESAAGWSLQHDNLKMAYGDLSDMHRLARAMEGCRFVFHVAGLARPWAPSDSLFFKINTEGTQNILEAARMTGVQRVVFTSTGGVFSPGGSQPADEDTPRSVPFFNAYEQSKAEAEDLVRAYVEDGNEAVIVNPTRVFGPGKFSTSNAVTKMIRKYVFGSWRFMIGDGQSVGNYTFVDDVVQGHLLALQHGQPGHRYILGGTNLSYAALFDVLARISGVHRKMIGIPMWLALGIGQFEQWKADSFGVPPLITPDWLKKYNYDWALSSEKAREEIGYSITPVEDALLQTIHWLEKAGNLR